MLAKVSAPFPVPWPVSSATSIEASGPCLKVAKDESERRGHDGRVDFRHGDFVELARAEPGRRCIPALTLASLARVEQAGPASVIPKANHSPECRGRPFALPMTFLAAGLRRSPAPQGVALRLFRPQVSRPLKALFMRERSTRPNARASRRGLCA